MELNPGIELKILANKTALFAGCAFRPIGNGTLYITRQM
jgi:hypothetical protein